MSAPERPALVVVPARGGSKGIPDKNLQRVGGVPLVVRAVQSALLAGTVNEVVVSTDDDSIAQVAADAGAVVVRRPAELSGDEASSESAILHTLDEREQSRGMLDPVTVLVQCTSPFIAADDLDAAISTVASGEADVCFSVTSSHAFIWRPSHDGMQGVNHDPAIRHRRQDMAPEYRETGAFYAMETNGLRSAGHRFFGKVTGRIVEERTSLEIDTPHDLLLAQSLADLEAPESLGIDVDALVTDFDGVHTDNTATVDQDGRESVRVSRSDGMGISVLTNAGIRVAILSTETNPVVSARAQKLGIPVIQGVQDKGKVLGEWMAREDVHPDRVAYLGNDINDLGAMSMVGWPIAVADAHHSVRTAARVVLRHNGGDGAVREACEQILNGRANHDTPN